MNSRNHRREQGFALLPILLSMALVGALIGFGLDLIAPQVKQSQYAQTSRTIDAALAGVFGWAAVNGRLPDYSEFPGILKNTTDAWSMPLGYVYDAYLTAAISGGVCGRSSTRMTADGTADVAFLVVSGGSDLIIDTVLPVNGVVTASTSVSMAASDYGRRITLAELKNRVGCFGKSSGRLRILNNQLPGGIGPKPADPLIPGSGCSGQAYMASLFADGGVPAASPPYYTWICSQPAWITVLTATGSQLDIQGTPPATGVFPMSVRVQDSDGNSDEKSFTITVAECIP